MDLKQPNKSFISKWWWLILIFVIALIVLFLRDEEDAWIQDQNGNWIKHGNPSSPMPEQEQTLKY